MQKEKQFVPKLRFPEFDKEWESRNIKEILTIGSGRDYKHLENGVVPVYGSGGLMRYVSDYLYDGDSIGIGRKGTIDNPIFLTGKFWTVDTLFYTHSFRKSDIKFIYNQFQRINWKKYNEAGGVPSLSKKTIEQIPIKSPTLPEQQKIANFLTSIDTQIQTLSTKKTLLEQYKKGVLQKIFKQEIRFKDEDGNDFAEWEKRKFADVLFEHKLKSTGKEEVHSVSVHKGVINQIEHLGRSFAAKDTSKYNRALPYDIIYTKSPTGDFPLGIIKQNHIKEDVILSPLYGVFTPETKELGYILHVYFESSINTSNYLSSIIQKGAKNTINITNTTFLSKKMLLPVSKEEQIKIADFLSAIDKNIALVNTRIEHTKSYKKGLLQQMFV
ncbi:restriction endonuclease subunit S [uncultured Polaribacter sp.]|uniref:restriction endonuclease subunit S n=1 Tax=uncultured Polaribacter sp. TaxID=174711 RepID=UPI002617A215|nr:restriction endonuclease subunit S [uncultured Polaribacter sp.]